MMTIEELSAREHIRELIYRSSRALDRRDKALMQSIYHPGAKETRGMWTGDALEYCEVLFERMKSVSFNRQHHITNILISVDGDRAGSESYYLVYRSVIDPKTGEEVRQQVGGRYLDRFEQRGGTWKITERLALVEWANMGLPDEVHDLPSLVSPDRFPDDPSYAFLARSG